MRPMSMSARAAAVLAAAWLGLTLGAAGLTPAPASAASQDKPPRKPAGKAATPAKPSDKTPAKPTTPTGKEAPAKPVILPGTWNSNRDGEAFLLQYGTAGAPAPTLLATCWPGAGLFQILVEVSSPKARSGDAVRLVLGNGKVSVEFAASVFASATEGRTAVEAQVTLEPKLVELFKQGEQLKVTVPGITVLLPLAGVKRRIDDFEKACLRARILPAATPAAAPAPAR